MQTQGNAPSGGRSLGLLRYRWSRPYRVMGLALLVVLVLAVLIPLGIIIVQSFLVQGQSFDVRLAGKPEGSFSTVYWRRMFQLPLAEFLLYKPLLNTLTIAGVTGVLATFFGTALAWLATRTDLPGRKLIPVLVLIPNIAPSFALSLAWLLVFRTREVSGTSGFLEQIGLSLPSWIGYGPFAIITVLTVNYIAFSYLLVSIALRKIDGNMEANATVLGASTFRILRTVTFPLAIPAVVSSFILTAAAALGTFAVPQFLGAPVRYNMLSTVLYQNVTGNRYGEAYVQTILMITLTAVLIWLYAKLVLSGRRSYATVGGKGFKPATQTLGRWRWPVGIGVLGALGVAAIVPLLFIVTESFLLTSGRYSLDNLTLHYWTGRAQAGFGPTSMAGVFSNASLIKAMLNTLQLGFISALLVGVATLLFGYVIVRGKGSRLALMVDQASFVPYLIPGIVFGAMYLSSYAAGFGPFPPLYGSYALVVAACVANLIPFAARIGTNVLSQISADLEDTALTFGSWRAAFFRILVPMTRDGFVISFIIAFIGVAKELDLVALLIPARNPVLTWYALAYYQEGYFQHWSVVSIVLLALIFLVVGAAYFFGFQLFDREAETH